MEFFEFAQMEVTSANLIVSSRAHPWVYAALLFVDR
jgi:hypothetical protein